MSQKIFTFQAKTVTDGTVSVEAPTLELAKTIAHTLSKHGIAQLNWEQGSGDTDVDIDLESGEEDTSPDDGTHMMQTPRENAADNEEALNDYPEIGAEI